MSEEPKPQSHFPRASNASVLATFIAIIGCMLALGLIVYLTYLPNRGPNPTVDMSQVPDDQKWKFDAGQRKEHLAQLHASEHDKLTNYSWVDQGAGVVRVPVDRAIELVAQEQREGKR